MPCAAVSPCPAADRRMLHVIMKTQQSGDGPVHGGGEPTAEDLARLRDEAARVAAEARTMAHRQLELLARLHELNERIDAHRKHLDEERGRH